MSENLIALEEAQRIMREHVPIMPVEHVAVWQAVGLPLAEDIKTDIDLSPFANSAMDGYAVRSADLVLATPENPVTLEVVGHEAAGHLFEGEILPGQTVRIMTGAAMPKDADAVVKYEVVEVASGDGNEGSTCVFRAAANVGENVREAGLEAKRGQVVMHAGEVVTPAGAGLLASAGHMTVPVRRAPRVGIVSLGTELVDPSVRPQRGQIRDANASMLMASAVAAGACPQFYGIAADDERQIAELMNRCACECDFVITSGGASAGDYDYVRALVAREGTVLFDRVSLRPGKAITFGILGSVPFLGLSGNPAAACVGFELLARPALRAMRGFGSEGRPVQYARAAHPVKKSQQRRFYNRARVGRDERSGELVVREAPSQNSALLGTMHHANCLLMVPEGPQGYEQGELVPCVRVDVAEGTVL